MHLKNFSLIETVPGSSQYVLSPAYDLLPVNLVMPEDTEETALTLNGKKRNLRRKDFYAFAESAGIRKNAAERMMDRILGKQENFEIAVKESELPESMKESFMELIRERVQRLL